MYKIKRFENKGKKQRLIFQEKLGLCNDGKF